MDHETNEAEPVLSGSFCQTSSVGSPVSRRSLILPRSLSFQVDDDIESENVSETGDIGDRALHSKRHSESGSIRLSIDKGLENGMAVPISEGSAQHDSTALNTRSPVSLLPEEIISPISIDVLVCSKEKHEVRIHLIICLNFVIVDRICLVYCLMNRVSIFSDCLSNDIRSNFQYLSMFVYLIILFLATKSRTKRKHLRCHHYSNICPVLCISQFLEFLG